MEKGRFDLFEKIKKIKGIEYIIIGIVALIIIFIVFSDGISTTTKETDSVEEYVASLENRLVKTLSQIKGAGKISVAISVSGGNTTLIAQDKSVVKNGEELTTTETAVLVGGKVVVLGEVFPEISGVIIVSQGADNISVKLDLLSATMTLLSVPSDRVEILLGK